VNLEINTLIETHRGNLSIITLVILENKIAHNMYLNFQNGGKEVLDARLQTAKNT